MKKFLTLDDIVIGMKVRHTWIVDELLVVNTVIDPANEILYTHALIEAIDGYLYLGDPGVPYLKL